MTFGSDNPEGVEEMEELIIRFLLSFEKRRDAE